MAGAGAARASGAGAGGGGVCVDVVEAVVEVSGPVVRRRGGKGKRERARE